MALAHHPAEVGERAVGEDRVGGALVLDARGEAVGEERRRRRARPERLVDVVVHHSVLDGEVALRRHLVAEEEVDRRDHRREEVAGRAVVQLGLAARAAERQRHRGHRDRLVEDRLRNVSCCRLLVCRQRGGRHRPRLRYRRRLLLRHDASSSRLLARAILRSAPCARAGRTSPSPPSCRVSRRGARPGHPRRLGERTSAGPRSESSTASASSTPTPGRARVLPTHRDGHRRLLDRRQAAVTVRRRHLAPSALPDGGQRVGGRRLRSPARGRRRRPRPQSRG